ncbi:Uncharacterised protein [Mycobacteroides abscessus subsp. massiliense]|nr:Uncharacterised protein [Mycobacteroides abscessus subsp. massiliense]
MTVSHLLSDKTASLTCANALDSDTRGIYSPTRTVVECANLGHITPYGVKRTLTPYGGRHNITRQDGLDPLGEVDIRTNKQEGRNLAGSGY